MLEKLKLLYPSVDESILCLLLDNVKSFIISYCGLKAYDESTFDSIALRMVQEDLNALYAEGFTSESCEGTSVSYCNDYSPRIYNFLNSRKKIRTVGATSVL